MMRGRTATLLTAIAMLVPIASPALVLPAGATLEASARPPAVTARSQAAPLVQPANAAGPARYIVILAEPSVPSYTGGIAGYEATNPAARGQARLDAESAPSQAYAAYLKTRQDAFVADAAQALGRAPQVVYQLQFALNAVIMVLDPAEAAQIAKLPGVTSVERDVVLPLDTDVGPQWIGAPAIWNGTGTGGLPGTKGEGVIIGVLDTGINMDHPSFAATGGDGYVHTNPFGAGNYKGWCNPSNPNYNPAYVCNAKLVGAWDYADPSDGPEDDDGHGSHTASTAAGNYLAPGTVTLGSYPFSPAISGIAPHANIIMYDVCTTGGCPNTATIAALDQAILDGVHVTNESIGIGTGTFTGGKQQAYLSVFNAGITSVRSAGNDGPGAGTVGHTPPWVITVGANTHNRAGSNAVTSLSGGSTAPPGGGTLTGLGVSDGSAVGELVYAGEPPYNDSWCGSPAAPNTFTGKIVVCDRGGYALEVKGWNVLQGGAIGMVVANNAANGASLKGVLHHLPAVHISYADGVALKTWMASGTGHQGRIAGTTFSYAPGNGDIMASFSSRGPHPFPNLLTPDVTNPGVDILAAFRSGVIGPGTPSVEYAFESGTSMSSPHTAGSAALVRALHPTWSPAEIKSALMGTGKYTGIRKEDGVTPATPFDMGAGRVDLNNAGNASLLLDETGANFAAGAANPKALNLPSLADAACPGTCAWTRTVKAARAGTWTATYVTPAGMTLSATPSTFTLTAGQTQILDVQADVTGLPLNQYAFGYVVLTQGAGTAAGDVIHLTVAVRPIAGSATIAVNPTSLAAAQATNTTTSQTLTIGNTGSTPLTWNIAEAPASAPIELTLDGAAAPDAPNGPISLVLDDGSREHGIGIGSTPQFIFLNRFTPSAGSYPITLNQVQVYFAAQDQVLVGDDMRLAIYENTSGNTNPAVGSNLRATFDVTVGALNAWNVYNLATPVTFNGPGDILIGVIALEMPGSSYWPAALDQTPPSRQRSFAGWWTTPVAPSPPTLPPNQTWGLIDNLNPSLAGNWMVRGYGEGSSACDNPADVPWLTVTPTGATTAPGVSSNVTVGFDSTGLALGTYSAVLCVTSNDPDRPLVAVPVSLTVTGSVTHTVTASVGTPAGTIMPPSQTVVHGTTTTFTLTPDAGYEIANVTGTCPAGSFAGNVYTTGAITADCTVIANFRQLTHTVTASVGTPSGTIAPPTQTVAHGATTTFTLTPDSGYEIANVTGTCPAGSFAGNVYTTGAITADCTVIANFRLIPVADPNCDVDPLSLSSTQAIGATTTQMVTVSNTGGGTLSWSIAEEPAAIFMPPTPAAADARRAPATVGQSVPRRIVRPEAVLFNEGFEGGVVPPTGWTLQVQAPTTWEISTTTPHSGTYDAHVEYDPDLISQSEWLLSPEITLTSGILSFWSYGSIHWCRDTYDDCDLEVWLVVGPTAGDGDDIYVGLADPSWPASWTWAQSTFDLTPLLPGGAVRVGFRYVGLDGAEIAIDDVVLDGETGPVICANPADVPWLSEVPTSGTTAAGGTTPVTVTFDSTGLTVGSYTANLCVTSNDPDPGPGNGTNLVVVPVSLTVTAPVTHTVTASVGTPAGTIMPPSQTVVHGTTTTFTLTPDAGYEIANVTGTCPAGSLAGNVYTTGAITADCEVVANFRQVTHTVTASVGTPAGTIAPPSQTVAHGATATFTLTPDAGYEIANVTGTCPAGSLVGNLYTTGAITADCTVIAHFRQLTHTVTASVGTPAGTIAPPSQTVVHGASATFTLTPDSGYVIHNVGGSCPVGTLAGNVYTTGAITADCEVIANFRPEAGPGPSVLEIPTLGPAGGALLGLLLAGLGLGTLRRRRA